MESQTKTSPEEDNQSTTEPPSRSPPDDNPMISQDLLWPFNSSPSYVRERLRSPGRDAATQEELPLLAMTDEHADTLVFIDPAPSLARRSPFELLSVPHRLHSKNLLETGSNFFRKLYELRSQTRIRRHRGLGGTLAKGVQYVLDLTPAPEGDEALIFITELSCPMGIRTWARSWNRWNLPWSCVGGWEETESPPAAEAPPTSTSPAPESPSKESSESRKLESNVNTSNDPDAGSTGGVEEKILVLPLDYSAIRHRAGIERILHALEGLEPRLDSAPKFWTFFALAKLFEIATAPAISNHILAWLYEYGNALLIEIHPETVYRIACGIQSIDLCHQTFAILVGEEALLLLRDAQLRPPSETFHGRIRETLDDSETQRIEYASKGFLDRVLGIFIDLVDTEMSWLTDLINRQLATDGIPPNAAIVSTFTRCLKEYVRWHIYACLMRPARTHIPNPLLIGGDGYPRQYFLEAYTEMKPVERILSRTFWVFLANESLEDWESAFPAFQHRSIAELGHHLPKFQDQSQAVLRRVPHSELQDLATSPFAPASRWPQITLPGKMHHHSCHEIAYLSLLSDARHYIRTVSKKMLDPPDPESRQNNAFQLVDTLTCLTDDEYKYLPLWAGGNDDGSGGVFAGNDAPLLESGGFSAPGPNVHSGSAAPSEDSFTVMASSEAISTVQGASHRAIASFADVVSLGSMTGSLQRGLTRMDIRSAESEPPSGSETLGSIEGFQDDDTQAETLSEGCATVTMHSPGFSEDNDDDIDDIDDSGEDFEMDFD
ncbi:hypothetical protein V8E54_002999 [Elaphomyces granulatus]